MASVLKPEYSKLAQSMLYFKSSYWLRLTGNVDLCSAYHNVSNFSYLPIWHLSLYFGETALDKRRKLKNLYDPE